MEIENEKKQTMVVALSGGKDSTAMVLTMLDNGEQIDHIVYFDTGWEWPQMDHHINQLENYIKMPIWKLYPRMPFNYIMMDKPMVGRKGKNKGIVHRHGKGWPNPRKRWCTGEKIYTVNSFAATLINPILCIGYAADEMHRKITDPTNTKIRIKNKRFPLQEYGIVEAKALKICYDHGFNWDGLYEHFSRVSCFCCPLQSMDSLLTIRKHYPAQWEKMLQMDRKQVDKFRYGKTLNEIETELKKDESYFETKSFFGKEKR